MKHLNKFNNEVQYSAGIDSLGIPNVSLISDTGDIRYRKSNLNTSLIDAWIFSGRRNSDVDKNIVGLNGSILTPHGFKWTNNSGYPEGAIDYTKLFNLSEGSNVNVVNVLRDSIEFSDVGYIESNIPMNVGDVITIPAHKIKVTNISGTQSLQVNVVSHDAGIYDLIDVNYLGGVYEVAEVSVSYRSDLTSLKYNYAVTGGLEGQSYVMEQIVENKGSLVFDGVDDYCHAKNLPILTDYTVITNRYYLNNSKKSWFSCLGAMSDSIQESAYWMEGQNLSINDLNITTSFGSSSSEFSELFPMGTIYQTTRNYASLGMTPGSTPQVSGDLVIGGDPTGKQRANVAVNWYAVYDRTLSSEEIQKESGKLQSIWESKLIRNT